MIMEFTSEEEFAKSVAEKDGQIILVDECGNCTWLDMNRFKVCEHDKQMDIDKIRAEIMSLDYDLESVCYDYNDMAQTEEIHMICREEVLRIIDKYKAESEG